IFNKIKYPVIIAGKAPHESIVQQAAKCGNIKLIPNPDNEEMDRIISDAHISVLYTFQDTGMKLKLLASLHCSRHCIANSQMVKNTGLEELCSIRDSGEEIINEINFLMKRPFETSDVEHRKIILSVDYSNAENAEKLKLISYL
ncbi:MAG: glycosyltransferase family 1 protein, partial [Bacteroidia bacterium]|nr:glycosyltransferase family 1 protein [Bacteroidia bacterium]